MENPNNTDTHLSEEILTEIFAKLSLKSIFRFKSVCRAWKSAIESLYFRRRFVSLHQNISTPWSLLLNDREFIHFHGCETLSLPKSLGSYIPNISKISGFYTNVETSNGLVLIDGYMGVSYVGNPILQQWIVVPYPPSSAYSSLSSLVTRVDQDGVVLSFKLVRGKAYYEESTSSVYLHFCVYSSETGIWTREKLHCPHYFLHYKPPMTFHGTFYISPSEDNVNEVLIAHDFYDESKVCRVIPLPDNDSRTYFKSALTASIGFVMYIKSLDDNVLKVWRLLNNDDDSAWELVSEISLMFIDDNISASDDSIITFDDNIINYVPLTMHPYDPSIVYLWSLDNSYLVSCNLETQNYHIFTDQSVDDDFHVNHSECEKHMKVFEGLRYNRFQYVMPRWMASIPRPPQTEILDTASLLKLAQEKT